MVTPYKLFNKSINITNGIAIIVTAILTAIASEIKVIPFNGEALRFGLGSITFFLLLLIKPPASFLQTGFITGVFVVCFRAYGEMIVDHVPFWTSFINHLPALSFYFLFSLGFSMITIEKYKASPFLLGAFAVSFEFIANSVEHFMRYLLLSHINFGLHEWALLGGVALLRGYFVVGLYSSIIVSEQKKRMEEMLNVGSELYGETLYLQKSMNQIEKITASSHDLYRKLKTRDLHDLSVHALHIAQEIHEVKKDSQRILSGISKINNQKENETLFLSEVLHFVVTANKNYSEMLRKKIIFHMSISTDFKTNQQIPLLSVLNNLTANAVESITHTGEVNIAISVDQTDTCFSIKDSGSGIPSEDLPIIFEPGFTTKFNDHGVAATGIGLSHVQDIVTNLGGNIQVKSSHIGTTFHMNIPTKNIRKRDD
ncbi:sensor histidine kinase [bacterium LRH843]|nr:sensor histidine kinase [bacterium LRH843]